MRPEGPTAIHLLGSLDKQPIIVANRASEVLEPTTVDQCTYQLQATKKMPELS